MNNFKGLSKDLPPTTDKFQIEVNGDLSNKRYVGEFECKILTRKDRAQVSKHRAFLNGPMADYLDLPTLKFHYRISYLKFALVSYPKFWEESDLGYDLLDGNVVDEVYEKVLEFEDSWMTAIWGEDAVKNLRETPESVESDSN